jgi:hypothetical protein
MGLCPGTPVAMLLLPRATDAAKRKGNKTEAVTGTARFGTRRVFALNQRSNDLN